MFFSFKTFLLSLFLSVYPDGRVCISILHAPGDDPMGYESSAERWSPVQSVEKILLSVVSMLAGKEFPRATPTAWVTAKEYHWLKLTKLTVAMALSNQKLFLANTQKIS